MNVRQKRLVIVPSIVLYMLMQEVYANPNHLEPIRPYDPLGIGYDQAVFTSLIGKARAPLWMIERPSFSREYAVILRCKIGYDPNDNPPGSMGEARREQWFVEHVAPKEKIWTGVPIGPGGELLGIEPTKNVERHLTPVTKDLAQALQEAWLSVLELTRYGERYVHPLDGTTLQFYCGGLFGETHSPGTSLPAMLADLGRKLRALALSDEKGKEPLLKEADSLARKIAKDAEAEQIRLFGKKMPRRSLQLRSD